ncbi:putative ribosomal N-acetyltransferase YdaF [Lentibacillus sp. JNUCC-1]|uniref:GNAT family N-acetyltransferase n=1 Tax=Lentibacillus sp. JNUCC-1 TaxID=2654513 RepID=UPI0012E74353|nr:GNAT family protein [Lentibacillus sp. JNUCC-1]MUV37904.1 putative ribosomal N-acetyltransferase YdaF [Lentibacillus sp. JNUCC-1]
MFNEKIDENITLRMFRADEAEALFQLVDGSRTHLRAWLPWVDDITGPEVYNSFIKNTFDQYNNREGLTAGIFYNGELVGVAGFNALDWRNNIAKIGYWLGASWQGRGIVTKVVMRLIDHAFYDLGMNRIDIRAAVGNTKSRAIPERLGFTEEGRIRAGEWLYDHYVDHVVYGLLAAEWRV